jgi:uncharacterized protein YdiU (UPF0061 family)
MTDFLQQQPTYLDLPQPLWVDQKPVPVADPSVVYWNGELAEALEIPRLTDAVWGGSEVIPGSRPFSQAYAGHQFGGFTILGDGRAVVLGEHVTAAGRRVDLQLKGSGRTPFSRGGDGRAVLGPMLRELLISEFLHAAGIPTTRCLAVVNTGETVIREKPLPGALMVRVAESHLRVGTFEFAAQLEGTHHLQALLEYAIQRHLPQAAAAEVPAVAFLQECCRRQASLVAKWMAVGFVHGVMNTDNMAISGETIDYGPCAFLDEADPGAVYSSIDQQGRYAYGNQPRIAHWNLAVLASALLPLIDADTGKAESIATEALNTFPRYFQIFWREEMAAKFGIQQSREEDEEWIADFLQTLEETRQDYTTAFTALETRIPEGAGTWAQRWQARCEEEGGLEAARARMKTVNPLVIPRNYRMEEVLQAAEEGELNPALAFLEELRQPFDRTRDRGEDAQPPLEGTPRVVTYCGT